MFARIIPAALIAAALICNFVRSQEPPQVLSDEELRGKQVILEIMKREMPAKYLPNPEANKPREQIQAFIESAKNAKVLNRKELKAAEQAERDGSSEHLHSLRWRFQNETEKSRRLLELQIRLDLLPPVPKQLTFSQIKPLHASPINEEGAIRKVSYGGGLRFAERISDELIHVYATVKLRPHRDKETGRVVTEESKRFALFGLPEDLASKLENSKPVSFTVLIYGTYTYESASGELTIPKMSVIDDDLIQKFLPEIVPPAPPADKPIDLTRTWISSDGNFRIDAKVDSVGTDSVVLIKSDGAKLTVPFAKLSKEDSEWARAYRAATGPWSGPKLQ